MKINYLDEFIAFLASEKNASSHTIASYKRDIQSFFHFNKKINFSNITPKDVRKWLAFLGKKGLKRTTISRKLSSIRSFFKFLLRIGALEKNPTEPITYPIKERCLPKSLTQEEIIKIIDYNKRHDFIGIRDKAIKELLYSTGIRVSELTSLNLEDVNLATEILKVKGKGKKERIVPFGQTAKKAILEYLDKRSALLKKQHKTEQKALFLNTRGDRLTPRSVQRMIAAHSLSLPINSKTTPHLFRHSMATHLLEQGADLRAIQKLLGHASVGTTQIYTHLDLNHLKTIFEKAHPRGRKKKN